MPPVLTTAAGKDDSCSADLAVQPAASNRNTALLSAISKSNSSRQQPRRDSEADDWDSFLDSSKLNPSAFHKRELGHRSVVRRNSATFLFDVNGWPKVNGFRSLTLKSELRTGLEEFLSFKTLFET